MTLCLTRTLTCAVSLWLVQYNTWRKSCNSIANVLKRYHVTLVTYCFSELLMPVTSPASAAFPGCECVIDVSLRSMYVSLVVSAGVTSPWRGERFSDGNPYASSSLESRLASPRFDGLRPKQPQHVFFAMLVPGNKRKQELSFYLETKMTRFLFFSFSSFLFSSFFIHGPSFCCMRKS